MKKILGRALVLGGLLAGMCGFALAEEFLFRSTIIGSKPDTVIGGVQSAVGAWTVRHGSAALTADGRFRVEVAGLVITSLGNPGPVKNISASLVCGGTGGSVVATTDAVPLSPEGNAEIESRVTIPSACFGPVVLVRAVFNGNAGQWIAATGFTQGSEPDASDGASNN
jgi:hypothetical protein